MSKKQFQGNKSKARKLAYMERQEKKRRQLYQLPVDNSVAVIEALAKALGISL